MSTSAAPQENLLDRAIDYVSPYWANRRRAARCRARIAAKHAQMLGDYLGRRDDERLRGYGWPLSRLSPDSGLEQDLEEVRLRSEDLYRKNPWYNSYCEGLARYVVGTGRTPQSHGLVRRNVPGVDTKKLRAAIEWTFAAWSQNAGVRGETLAQLQVMLVLGRAVEGDQFAILRNDPLREPIPIALEIVSGTRVETPDGEAGNPRIRNGIEYDEQGRRVAIHVRTHPGDTVEEPTWEREPFYDRAGRQRVFHYRRPCLAGFSRGLPDSVPVQADLRDLDDWCENEMMRLQAQSSQTLWIETPLELCTPEELAAGSAACTDSKGRTIENSAAGEVSYLPKGRVPHFPPVPDVQAQLDVFMRWKLLGISAGLSWSFELLTKAHDNSYAGGRLALTDAHRRINTDATLLDDQVLRGVCHQVIARALIVDDLLPIRPTQFERYEREIVQTDWLGEPLPWIDPAKEIEAEAMALYLGLETFDAVLKRRQIDPDEWAKDRQEMRALFAKLNVPDFVPRGWGLNERVPKGEIGNPAQRSGGGQPTSQDQPGNVRGSANEKESGRVLASAKATASVQPAPADLREEYQPANAGGQA